MGINLHPLQKFPALTANLNGKAFLLKEGGWLFIPIMPVCSSKPFAIGIIPSKITT